MRLEKIVDKVKETNGRMTKTRYAMIEIMKGADYPLTASEVMERLKFMGIKPDKATVYRQLEFLTENGILRGVRLKDDIGRYEFAADDSHVHHLICNNCDSVSNIHLQEDLEEIERQIVTKQGFHVEQHTLEFYGTCKDCQ